MRYVLSAVGVLAAVVFVLASAIMNWVFWSGQGHTDLEGKILGAVSGAVDVFKCLLPFFIARSWMTRKWVFVGIGSSVFCFFLSFSLMSAIGFAAGNRGLVAGGREAISVRLDQAASDLANAEQKRKTLPTHRAAPVVEEALKGIQQDRRYTSSKSCAEATAKDSREFCKGFFEVRAELAVAIEEDRLTKQIETLTREGRQLREQGAGQDRDPQAHMLSVLSGLELDSAQKFLIIFVAVLVELGAAFGLYLATGWATDAEPITRDRSQKPASASQTLPVSMNEIDYIDVEPEPEPAPTPELKQPRDITPKRPRKATDRPQPAERGTAIAAMNRPRRLEQFADGSWGVKT